MDNFGIENRITKPAQGPMRGRMIISWGRYQ
jgi:hypothetical protein